jgi:competence protein ComEC
MINNTIAFIFGIIAFHFFSYFPLSITALCILTSALLFFKYLIIRRFCFSRPVNSETGRKGVILFVSIFAFSVFYSFIREKDIPEVELPGTEVSLEGDISDVPEMSNAKIRFTIDHAAIRGMKIPGKVRLFLSPEEVINKTILLSGGERVRAVAKLRQPATLHNPGVYPYDLKKDGIAAVGSAKKMQIIGGKNNLTTWIRKQRMLAGNIIDSSLSPEAAAFQKAIIPGLTGGISQEMRDSFSSTGLAHILSISGTHFGLLALIIFNFIKLVIKYLPEKLITKMTLYITSSQIAVLATIPVLISYAIISGMSTPTIRSLIMISIYMFSIYIGRKDQWLNSLSIAAFIILLWQPEALFDLSFQLSFIAVLSIGYAAEKRTEVRRQIIPPTPLYKRGARGDLSGAAGMYRVLIDKTRTAMLMTVTAVLGTAPLIALSFKQFPLISPASNLIVTPFVCFLILPMGFFASCGAFLFGMTSLPLGSLLDTVTRSGLWLTKIFSQIPCSNIHVPNPSIMFVILYYIAFIFLVRSPHQRAETIGKVKYLPASPFALLPLTFVVSVYLMSTYLSGNDLKVVFLDVGQGDSSFVRLPDKKTMLIDGGAGEPDMGRNVIAPYLWSRGIKSIDYLVLTHPHPDHFGGLIYIMDNFKVGEIWLNGRRTCGTEEFFRKIKEEKIRYKVLRRGDILEAEEYRIYVFHPYDEFFADSSKGGFSDENSASLVLKIEAGSTSILFTGDIETEAEDSLLPLGKWMKSDIIKVAHHGGRTSSSPDFLAAVKPQIAVVSVGRNNSFHHPHKETVDRYRSTGATIYRTDIDGAVTVTVRKGGAGLKTDSPDTRYEVQTYGDSSFRKVAGWRDEIRNLKLLFSPS